MRNKLLKKTLVIVIILLFVGSANHLLAISIDADITSDSLGFSFTDTCLLDGWPVTIGEFPSSPISYDFNNDGSNEIVIEAGGNIYLINSDGTIVSGWPVRISTKTPAIGDINNDGTPELVTHNGPYVYVLNPDGSIVWQKESSYSIYMGLVLADLDGDRYLEIILTTSEGGIFVLSHDGNRIWGCKINNVALSTPAVCDLDGDGNIEIVLNSEDDKTYVFNHNGTLKDNWPVNIPSDPNWYQNLLRPPVIADLDGDGDYEIVRDGGSKLYVLEFNGNIASGWPQNIMSEGNNAFCLGDIDSDNLPEIVFARNGGNSGYLYAFNGDGSSVPGWPISTCLLHASCVIGDVDSSLPPEIIVRSRNRIVIYEADGTILPGWPKFINDSVYSSTVVPSPLITDLDGDGYIDIIAPSFHNQVYAWSISGIYNLSRLEWPMFQHDSRYSGLYMPMSRPPNPPDIDGSTSGTIGEVYEYIFVSTDPESDNISYFIDWGDCTYSGWTDFVASGTEIVLTHVWEKPGTFNIKVKAKDTYPYGAESVWSTFSVTMPRNKATNNLFLYRFLEQFPFLERFLTLLMK